MSTGFFPLLLLLVDVVYQTFRIYDLLHKFRECLPFKLCTLSKILNDAGIKIYCDLISCINAFGSFRTFDDREPDVDRIPVKDTRESFGDHATHPCRFDSDRGMFP